MSTSYRHFTTDERESLEFLQAKGLGIRAMARELGRSPSSVSRELRRNRGKDGRYRARKADAAYQERRKRCVRRSRLSDPARWSYVEKRLLRYWSPEQIAGRLKWKHPELYLSYSTIYRGIYSKQLQVPPKVLRRGGKRRPRNGKETRGRLHGQKSILDRPRAANTRSQYGHYEGDTVRGAKGKGVAMTFVDRRSGFLVASVMPDRKAATMTEAWCKAFAAFPASLKRTFTVDNGNEFFSYQEVEEKLDTRVYFAQPYKPWQRGANENLNGLLRQFYPKGCDFLTVTPEEFQAVVDLLNHRPRKRLGFRSPAECFPTRRLLHLD